MADTGYYSNEKYEDLVELWRDTFGFVQASTNLTGRIGFSVNGMSGATDAVIVGDSILAQGHTNTNYSPIVLDSSLVSGTALPSTRAKGMVPLLNALLGQPFRVVWVGAVSGTTTTTILASTSVAFARSFDVVFENGGTNDISLYATEWGGSMVAAENGIVSNRLALWVKAAQAGARMVVALAIPPVAAGASWSAAQTAAVLRANRRLADAAAAIPYVRFIDIHEPLVDSASATGYFKASISDGDRHPTGPGAYLAVKKIQADGIVASFARKRPMLSSLIDCVQSDATNKNLLNASVGLGTGSSGVASGTGVSGGTVLTGVTVSRYAGTGATIAASIVAAPNGVGNAQRFVITAASAADQVRVLILPGISLTEMPKGSWAYAECMCTVSSSGTPGSGAPTGLTGLSLSAGTQFSGSTIVPGGATTSVGLAAVTSEPAGASGGYGAETFTLVSEPVWLPSDISTLSFAKMELFATFGSSGSATVDIYQMRLVKM